MAENASEGLAASIEASVAAMSWLEPSDGAAVALALTYARRIDKAVEDFEEGLIDTVALNKVLYLGPHILNTLRALGGTPAERKALLDGEGTPGGKLDELKARRQKKATG